MAAGDLWGSVSTPDPGTTSTAGSAMAATLLASTALGDSSRDTLDPVVATRRRLRRSTSGPPGTLVGTAWVEQPTVMLEGVAEDA